MRYRTIIVVAVAAAFVPLAVATPSSSAKFANCHSWRCVNRKLNQLYKLDVQEVRAIRHVDTAVYDCERTTPVTLYGSPPSTGYLFYDGVNTYRTDALSFTRPGDVPDAHVLVDVCSGTARASFIPHLTMSGH